MWRLGVLCAFDVPLCGSTAFDVRAGLFEESGLTGKYQLKGVVYVEGILLLT
jgi:hypothetical protein